MDNQKGVSLIIVFFIMIIVLAVVLSISALLYSQVKVIRNIGNSVISYYAAESGVEKVLYYDRQVLPTNGESCGPDVECASPTYSFCSNGLCIIPSSRGLCSIFDQSENNNYCSEDQTPDTPGDHSIFCNDPILSDSCDPAVCDDCTIRFNTTFDNRTYFVTATVNLTNLDVQSTGDFDKTERKIKIFTHD